MEALLISCDVHISSCFSRPLVIVAKQRDFVTESSHKQCTDLEDSLMVEVPLFIEHNNCNTTSQHTHKSI